MATSFFHELKRRNVIKVGASYLLLGWIVLQVADVVVPILELPDWTLKLLLFLGLFGFPFALFFAWIYELTPEGIKKESEVSPEASIASTTGNKLNAIISVLLIIAVGYIVADKTLLNHDETRQNPNEQNIVKPVEISPSIAVLPFVNMSGNPDNEYFSDGLTETLLHKLAQVPDLKVAARTSSFAFKGQNSDIRNIAHTLDVANVLEGSVQRAGNKVRITAQLIQAETGYHLWSKVFDRNLNDIFAVQDDIAAEVASALRGSLLDESIIATDGSTQNTEAYDEYLKGKNALYKRNATQLPKAVAHFRKAIALSPNFALAWAGLSEAIHEEAVFSGKNYQDGIAEVVESARTAVRLAPNNVLTRVRLGNVLANRPYSKLDEARMHLQRALEIDPENALALSAMSELLWSKGEYLRAVEYGEKAMAADPLNWVSKVEMVNNYQTVGKFTQAEQLGLSIVNNDPDYVPGLQALGNFYWRTGQQVEAFRIYHRLLTLNPKTAYIMERIGESFLSLGGFEGANRWFAKSEAIAPESVHADRVEMLWLQGDFDAALSQTRARLTEAKAEENAYPPRIHRLEAFIAYMENNWQAVYDISTNQLQWYENNDEAISDWRKFSLKEDIALALWKLGRLEERDQILHEILAFQAHQQESGSNNQYSWNRLARVYALQGDAAMTLEALEQAYAGGLRERLEIMNDPVFDSVRDDSGIQQFLDKLAADNREQLKQLYAVEKELGDFN